MSNQGGFGNNIDGIPLPGDMPQVDSSASPNREDSVTLSNPDFVEDEHPERYFKDMEDALGNSDEGYIPNKAAQESAEAGIEDEENDYGLLSFTELDNDWNEGLTSEAQPLHLATDQPSETNIETVEDAGWGVELQSDQIEGGP
jgi:hypothetical protein